jgi:hypothetical protein
VTAAADLLAGWRAWRAAQSAEIVPGVPGAAKSPGTPPKPQTTAIVPGVPGVPDENDEGCAARTGASPTTAPAGNAWGLTEAEKAAALARLAGAAPTAEQPAEALPPADWRRLPHGAERGRAFAEARAMPGACPCCAGRRWWREADEAPPGRCMACHPPPPGLAVTVTETRAGTYLPGDPDPLRDGLLRGARDHRNLR